MIEAPRCGLRHCRHFQGFAPPEKGEEDGRPICEAFPEGIPSVIVFGPVKHTKPFLGDNGIQYEKIPDEEIE